MISHWQKYPFLRLLFPLCTGILLSQINIPIQPVWYLACSAFLIFLYCVARHFDFKTRVLFGVALNILFISCGYLSAYYHNELNQSNHFSAPEKQYFLTQITDDVSNNYGHRYIVRIYQQDTTHRDCTGNLLVYLNLKNDSTTLNIGDWITLHVSPERIKASGNPEAFDLSRYWHFQNVHYRCFIAGNDFKIVEKNSGFSLVNYSLQVQKKLLGVLKKHLPTPNEYATASALLLGAKSEMTDEVKNAYINTGSMHILAVSGMHIVLIFAGLDWLLSFYKSGDRRGLFAKTIIQILLIWSFTFIVGMGASILRAAVMATCLALGRIIRREASVYNILAASAFLLLVYNPFMLYDVGFQLSYFAVVGIVIFFKPVQKLVITKYKIINLIWDTIAVGLAAQIAVTPLSLYYFHQFPTYFWLSGILAVPVSSVALYAGIVLFFTDAIPILGLLVGKIFYWSIWLMNAIIFSIQHLPFSLISGIWLTTLNALLVYVVIIGASYAVFEKKLRLLMYPLLSIFILSCLNVSAVFKKQTQKQIVIYNIAGNTLVDCFDVDSCFSIIAKNERDTAVEKKINYAAQNHRWAMGIKNLCAIHINSSKKSDTFFYVNGFLQFYDKRILILDALPSQPIRIPFDAVLIIGNPRIKLADLQLLVKFNTLIFDASNYKKNVAAWKEEVRIIPVSCFDVRDSGAWIFDF